MSRENFYILERGRESTSSRAKDFGGENSVVEGLPCGELHGYGDIMTSVQCLELPRGKMMSLLLIVPRGLEVVMSSSE